MIKRGAALMARTARLLHTSPPSTDVTDKVLLRGLIFHGYHGVLEEERRLGQKFVVDATLETSLQKAGCSDDLNDTINYAAVYEDIKSIVEGEPRLLIESVAESIAQRVLAAHPTVAGVAVRVQKPHVAVSGPVAALGVEITRRRGATAAENDTKMGVI